LAKRIFITATNTDIGKTHATKLLLKEYSRLGYSVAAFKPIETGVTTKAEDATALLTLMQELNPKFDSLHVSDISPINFKLPAAPYIANSAQNIDTDIIIKALEKLEKICDIVIIEGAGGLYVPVDKNLMMIDFIELFSAKALLVSHCKLGCINDTLLSIKALQDRDTDFLWTLNCKDEDSNFDVVSKRYFDDRFEKVFYLNRDSASLAKALID
jgi:dethiobiotin synthetase